ncbi:unnamed protein product [Adineta steineri]|uniref:G-protein coupled receptors family 1 profile domain-containing protein n=1 Tax=Adineta steineri TaxID=433720 RepID=A0A818PRL2_9BILA|nr:unnamed protein product [Adineta steineri]
MMAFHMANFTYITTLILPSVLSIGYGVTFITYTLGFCRFTLYMSFVLDILSPTCLVLASIDRILVTSPNALTRQRSTCHLAYWSIICATLFWMLCHSHSLVLMYVIQVGSNIFTCYTQSSIYLVVIGYYSLVKSILIPSLLASLGLLAIRNIRSLTRNRVVPDGFIVGIGNNRGFQLIHSKDRQLDKNDDNDLQFVTVLANIRAYIFGINLTISNDSNNYVLLTEDNMNDVNVKYIHNTEDMANIIDDECCCIDISEL